MGHVWTMMGHVENGDLKDYRCEKCGRNITRVHLTPAPEDRVLVYIGKFERIFGTCEDAQIADIQGS